jgi:hypothetical protein
MVKLCAALVFVSLALFSVDGWAAVEYTCTLKCANDASSDIPFAALAVICPDPRGVANPFTDPWHCENGSSQTQSGTFVDLSCETSSGFRLQDWTFDGGQACSPATFDFISFAKCPQQGKAKATLKCSSKKQ